MYTGTSRALLFTLLCSVILIGLCLAELGAVSRVLGDADTYRRSGASILTFQAPGQIDAARCEALKTLPNVNHAGALRENPAGMRPAALPGHSIPQRDVTEGFIQLLTAAGSDTGAAPGPGIVLSDQVANALGRDAGGHDSHGRRFHSGARGIPLPRRRTQARARLHGTRAGLGPRNAVR
ncbi:hypothetical protein [Mycetocola tolaasinivorans]|uniref:hypothetical protein n=1 Tax=Mycetocola tolaasinivorans TaxID=76635 RepID=UPI0011C3E4A2|nr:hypothetical protein [Mycetocola tolaasinivorans]